MEKQKFRKELAQFRPYVPGKPIEEVKREYGLEEIEKLASNENQLGPSPMAVEAIINEVQKINFYPEASAIDLKKALAERLNVTVDNLVIGNGGEDVLQLIAQTFINEGDEVIVAGPSFAIYTTSCSLMGGKVVNIPFKGLEYDLEAMAAAVNGKTKLLYICNPNNPTGNIIPRERLEWLFANVPEDLVVVLDEAYYEFAVVNPDYADSIEIMKTRGNVVILRTFSKVCGIAGIRVGYGITTEEIATEMNKIKMTFGVNRLAQAAALGALKDQDHIKKTVDLNYKSLGMMTAAFDELGLEYIPSNANFIWVDVKKHSKDVFQEMIEKGVIIRPGFYWGWDNWIRVSTGTEAQTETFIKVLKEVL